MLLSDINMNEEKRIRMFYGQNIVVKKIIYEDRLSWLDSALNGSLFMLGRQLTWFHKINETELTHTNKIFWNFYESNNAVEWRPTLFLQVDDVIGCGIFEEWTKKIGKTVARQDIILIV